MEWIKIGYLCSKLSVLPSCGGLLDQDPRHVERLTRVLNLIDKHEADEIKKT